MKKDTKYLNKKEALLKALQLGWPNLLICKYLQISESTLYGYMQKLKAEKHTWVEASLRNKEPIRKRLEILAYIVWKIHPYRQSDQASINIDFLDRIIAEDLEVNKIQKILDHASYYLFSLTEARFGPEVPSGYQNLMSDLVAQDSKKTGGLLWYEYLSQVADGRTILPTEKELGDYPGAIIKQIMDKLTAKLANRLRPTFTADMCAEVDANLLSILSERQAAIIRMHYGLAGPKRNDCQIAKTLGLSANRVGEIRRSTMNRILKRNLDRIIFIPLNRRTVKDLIAKNVQAFADSHRLKLSEGQHAINDLNLSLGIKNALRAEGIQYLEDLQNQTALEVAGIRRIGKKYFADIQALMDKYQIEFLKK